MAARSTRDAGHGGLAQKRGHRSAVSLIQDLTGSTLADATKQVRIGEALAAASVPAEADAGDGEATTAPVSAAPAPHPWHAALGAALMSGALTSAQHDAIFRGLGVPPTGSDADDENHARDAWARRRRT
ncbi:hypothetical protein J2Y46_001650 [Microbacterium sp. BE35]|uniref:hypothetical protein n=1 Tax=Microbacterium sp. BE35 TaxID=2817773 RepID=UPI002864B244|nr:hypothetical protein [Microbacterium sp. BE35]MDR7188827.1 hypothetical protein [Microbacterium sp. BE35]